MDEPDFVELGSTTPWATGTWSDAWAHIRENVGNESQRQAVWDCILALSGLVRPSTAAHALVTLIYS